MKFAEEMKDIVKGKLLVTLTAFGNTNNGGKRQNIMNLHAMKTLFNGFFASRLQQCIMNTLCGQACNPARQRRAQE